MWLTVWLKFIHYTSCDCCERYLKAFRREAGGAARWTCCRHHQLLNRVPLGHRSRQQVLLTSPRVELLLPIGQRDFYSLLLSGDCLVLISPLALDWRTISWVVSPFASTWNLLTFIFRFRISVSSFYIFIRDSKIEWNRIVIAPAKKWYENMVSVALSE